MHNFPVPRLIISDVDGTLIDGRETIEPSLIKIGELRADYNLPLTLASGRCYANLKPFIDKLGITLPVIVNNGAGAVLDGEVLWGQYMDSTAVHSMVELADRLGMMVVFGNSLEEYVYRNNTYVQDFSKRYARTYQFQQPSIAEWEHLQIQKILLIDPNTPGRVKTVLQELGPYLNEVSYVFYDDRSVDIMPKNCNKSHGLSWLAAELGIESKSIMAIGDAPNDIEMITTAGIGVAVKNAVEPLKEIADYVCEGERSSGVLEAIERFSLK